ncbi:SIR2 family protein [Marinobacter salinisoli]|uniref:SIR2 family protein n=1 Tax=Marinobacter salinisoli TaxID=2769486 RepID=A0ABX7MRT4_9GAMM|nr:anti-phage defense-associated sirtuin Dsr1 [Marinobacter salinisoli]QSP95080.1 SIR2 family protein [Marinobacter salinisoli]
MQFIANGPDVPDELLQAHEEGRVVFFCGAGISFPAGLPGFGGLVSEIYKMNGTTPSAIEKEALDQFKYDAALDLLERRLPGQRLAVRRALALALKPKLRRKGATDTHAALLRLSQTREGALRLVTTNFDRVFHTAARRIKQRFTEYPAPMLPVPKNSRWDGLVYLHGLLQNKPNNADLNRLVITSGDFGLAYLTERWAARFVSELFRNYVVCFVGYSINDPVLRYMMDALAADRMLGEVTQQAWAFGECTPGQESRTTNEWEAKGVNPILYEVPPGTANHSALHQTVQEWATTYKNGTTGKENIVVTHALAHPSASTKQDDFVGRMLWALSDKTGAPARRFADFDPVPPLDWLLYAFSDKRFQHRDLNRFDVPPREKVDPKLRFSLALRPAPYHLAPPMQLASGTPTGSDWDAVMFQLARWLLRHLNDPRLILWAAQRGGQVHEKWTSLIEQKLEHIAKLQQEGKSSELKNILKNAPKAIPNNPMRKLWRLLIGGRVKGPGPSNNLYDWLRQLRRDGLNTTLRLRLRELLNPQVALRQPSHFGADIKIQEEPTRVGELVGWDLVLASDYVYAALFEHSDEYWKAALPKLLDDFQQLLRDALDLMRELDEPNGVRLGSDWDLPSIEPHWQNRRRHDWTSLVELLRDSWVAFRDEEMTHATRIAHHWFQLPYPMFKRLALFAASHDDCVRPKHWVNWLLSDGRHWLWFSETKREVCRLLTLQGRCLDAASQQRMETAILNGPPQDGFPKDWGPEIRKNQAEQSIWLRLAKLSSSGLSLNTPAQERLAELTNRYPHLTLAPNQEEEFTFWSSGTGDPGFEYFCEVDIAPTTRGELVRWLSKPETKQRPFIEDTWQEICRTHFRVCVNALSDLSAENDWPKDRWRQALQVWSEGKMASQSWKHVAPVVQTMPDDVLQEIGESVASWIKAVSGSINGHGETLLLNLCRRILSMPFEATTTVFRNGQPIEMPVTEAINHPVGHITEALLNVWLQKGPSDGDLLPGDIKQLFTEICNAQIESFRHGRVILASRVIALFRVDEEWTNQHLVPLFNWNNPAEAKALWQGFLWSPRLYQPLLIALKQHFLESAEHFSDLGEQRNQFAAFITYAALSVTEGYTMDEFRVAIESLPQEGLEDSAQALYQALEGSGDRNEEYWNSRVQPFWYNIWPKSRDRITPRISESLARLSIAARSEFPSALTDIHEWLQPVEDPNYIVHLLHKTALCVRFPEESLYLLDAVIADQQWPHPELKTCLDELEEAQPELALDPRMRRLREYYQRRLM